MEVKGDSFLVGEDGSVLFHVHWEYVYERSDDLQNINAPKWKNGGSFWENVKAVPVKDGKLPPEFLAKGQTGKLLLGYQENDAGKLSGPVYVGDPTKSK